MVATGLADANMSDVVRVGPQRLIGEILTMKGDTANIQVYEETSGLGPGAEVETTGAPMSVELGPGMIEGIYDGIQRPLEKIVEKRVGKQGIGFENTVQSKADKASTSELLKQVQPHDLLKFGIIPELVGRLPVIAALDGLTREDLVQILTQPKNALVKQYQKLFSYDDAELTFEPKALEAIADKAIERKIGARGLRAVMEGLLMNVMYDIPSDRTIDRVTITPGCVEGTEQPKISHRTEKEGEAPQPSLPADSAS